ncbi:MAG TPA: nucleotidyl transferase AbiEii/AbiGii toxin family protein [Bacteroidota bacterium]|jgi:predicted nucleotidyltransferase|nr:nucleotidyl transferase AbiEii/AbiGii toxin family protein [Bacteroidota bacterium]
MMNISNDISGKIDSAVIEAIAIISTLAYEMSIPLFLVGAAARDMIFSTLFDIQATRRTLDVDVAIRVASWNQVNDLAAELRRTGLFLRDSRIQHRFRFRDGVIFDMVPFGDVENPTGKVRWPSHGDVVMSTIGFREAFEHSIAVTLRTNPRLEINVCAPPGLAILKLMAWNDAYPARTKDAQDLLFIMKHYIDAGNDERLHDQDKDIMEEPDFDFGLASPRLLGRDMGNIASRTTREHITRILTTETGTHAHYRLISDMLAGELNKEERMEQTVTLLNHLRLGFAERS